MMNPVATLVCLVAVTQANFTVKQMQKIHASFVNCTTILHIPEDTVHYEQHTVAGNLSLKDPLYKRNLLCLMRGMQVGKPTGDVDLPRMREFLRDGHDEKTLEEMLEICAKNAKGPTPEEKAYQFHQCFWSQEKFMV